MSNGRRLRQPRRNRYDYVVIGAGSAGSAIAARLAEDNVSVLLLEAGPWDDSIVLKMPAALAIPLGNDKYNWYYHSEPEPHLNGRKIYEARGRVIGGSSSINGLNWVRGNPLDYDRWSETGNDGWAYSEVLPYFKKAESFHGVESVYRGAGGPMKVETCPADHILYQKFLKAGVEAGYPYTEDHNAFQQEGMHKAQRNVSGGVRWSASRAYLVDRLVWPNLDVVANARIHRIKFFGRMACGVNVKLRHEADVRFIEAEREVILCGGALNSPQLLLLSGVGRADDLRRADVPLVADVAGVGYGLKDHVAASVQYRVTRNVSIASQLTFLGKAKLGLEWSLFKTGLGASNFFEVGGFIRTDPQEIIPDIQYEFTPMLGEVQHGSVAIGQGFQYFLNLLRPTSEGRVWIEDADPLKPPRFVFNYLQSDQDKQAMIAAVRATRHIVAQSSWDDLRGEETSPGMEFVTDAQILAWLQNNSGTVYHPCRSCRMGSDDLAVTDRFARVHGVERLRVIDASIMPEIVSGNINAPVIMMAEKLADHIRGRATLAPEKVPYYLAG